MCAAGGKSARGQRWPSRPARIATWRARATTCASAGSAGRSRPARIATGMPRRCRMRRGGSAGRPRPARIAAPTPRSARPAPPAAALAVRGQRGSQRPGRTGAGRPRPARIATLGRARPMAGCRPAALAADGQRGSQRWQRLHGRRLRRRAALAVRLQRGSQRPAGLRRPGVRRGSAGRPRPARIATPLPRAPRPRALLQRWQSVAGEDRNRLLSDELLLRTLAALAVRSQRGSQLRPQPGDDPCGAGGARRTRRARIATGTRTTDRASRSRSSAGRSRPARIATGTAIAGGLSGSCSAGRPRLARIATSVVSKACVVPPAGSAGCPRPARIATSAAAACSTTAWGAVLAVRGQRGSQLERGPPAPGPAQAVPCRPGLLGLRGSQPPHHRRLRLPLKASAGRPGATQRTRSIGFLITPARPRQLPVGFPIAMTGSP